MIINLNPHIDEVIDSFKGGHATAQECAQRLLSIAGVGAVPAGGNNHRLTTRKRTVKTAGKQVQMFHIWLVDCAGVKPLTAQRYVARMVALQQAGEQLDCPERVLKRLTERPEDYTNVSQAKSAIRYWTKFLASGPASATIVTDGAAFAVTAGGIV